MLTPNTQQVQSGIRWLLTGFGSGLIGYVAARLNISGESIINLLSSEAIAGIASAGIALLWSLLGWRTNSQIVNVAAMDEVKKIETTPAIAAAIPSAIVVSAPASKLSADEKLEIKP